MRSKKQVYGDRQEHHIDKEFGVREELAKLLAGGLWTALHLKQGCISFPS